MNLKIIYMIEAFTIACLVLCIVSLVVYGVEHYVNVNRKKKAIRKLKKLVKDNS